MGCKLPVMSNFCAAICAIQEQQIRNAAETWVSAAFVIDSALGFQADCISDKISSMMP